MNDFLLELLCEEIPARMQAKARVDLEKLFTAQMADAGLKAESITVYSTPRRLALIAKGLPQKTEAVSDEVKGPPQGAPDQAIDGFCRKNGVTRDDLEVRDIKGRATYFAVINTPGRATTEVLAETIPAIIRAFPWPKSQRWGEASISTESLRWVRPLQGIIALFDGAVVETEVDEVKSGLETVGHRFHSSGPISIKGVDDYTSKLRDAHVIVDQEGRQNIVREGAAKAASDAGLSLVEDEGLVIENAGLTEWPVPLLGRFDEGFLNVPPEVIQLTARVNQKYFVVQDADGNLANGFVCTANLDASDGGKAIVAGNEKVLAARLADAKFFWELDQKTTLAEHAKGLERITFHEKLGTVADKVERVAKLARWLCEEGIVKGDPDLAQQAAQLCKADLVTEMVGEFPELQGLMGGYYAEKEGLDPQVAAAIRDHYKPVGQDDDVPTAPVTVAVSLADKLDTLTGFFLEDMPPTGSKDPFALRRAAIAVISLILSNELRFQMEQVMLKIVEDDLDKFERIWDSHLEKGLAAFFADRLKVQQKEAGVRHDLIDAVFALGGEDDLVRLLARVKALQSFVETDDGANLLAGYKRAANILKKENVTPAQAGVQGVSRQSSELDSRFHGNDQDKELVPTYTSEPAETALIDALASAKSAAAKAVKDECFEDAMAALATLRAPIDKFFDTVTVNDSDETKRRARLALLQEIRDVAHSVADFSRIEG